MEINKGRGVTLTVLGYDERSRYYKFHISGNINGNRFSVNADYTPNHFTNFEGEGVEIAKRNRAEIAAFAPSFIEEYNRGLDL